MISFATTESLELRTQDESHTKANLAMSRKATCLNKPSPKRLTMKIGNKLFCPRSEHSAVLKRSRNGQTLSPISHQRHATAATSYLVSLLTALSLAGPPSPLQTLGNGPQMQITTIRAGQPSHQSD